MATRASRSNPGAGEANADTRAGAGPVARLTCPRCSYDLSGPVGTWDTSCPVEGVCPECGLTYRWGDVFDPLRDVPAWFFELAPHRRTSAFALTILRTLIPWRFWDSVRLGFPIRYRRLVILIGLLVVAWQLVPGLIRATHYYFVFTTVHSFTPRQGLAYVLRDWGALVGWPLGDEDDSMTTLGVWILTSAILPCCFLAISETLHKARVRPAHLLRATVYATLPIILVWFAWKLLLVVVSLDPFGWRSSSAKGVTGSIGRVMSDLMYLDYSWPVYWPLFMLLTWWCICRFYLRIKHAFPTALLLLILALLLTPIVGYPLGFFTDFINWLI